MINLLSYMAHIMINMFSLNITGSLKTGPYMVESMVNLEP